MEGVRCDDDYSSPAIDRCRIGMRAVDEIRQQEYDKLCSEGRWTSPFAFITEERLRRSEWGSFTAQQIYIRDFLVSRGSDKRRTTEEEARAKLAYVYRSGEVRLCTHPGDLEEMTESDDEDLRAQSTPGFYEHSSRLNWRHSLVELPRHQKERERFKAVIEMRKFSFVLVDERTKAELDYFQALPAQARHSIARTKPTTWHVFEETPRRNISPSSSSTSSNMSACDLASTTSGSDLGSATSACDLAREDESAGERTLPSPRPSIGCESSATDDEESDGRECRPSSGIFASPSRNNVTATTPCAFLSSSNDFEGREKAPVDESFDESFDEFDSPPQDDHSANSPVAEGSTSSAGCSRRLMNSKQRLGRCADGAIQAGTTFGKYRGSGRGSKGGNMYDGAEDFRETGSANSCGGSVGIDGGGDYDGGSSGGEGARAAAARGDTRRSTPAPASWTIGRTGEWAATSSATDGGGSTGFSGGCGSGDINHHPNSSEGRFRQKTCSSASTLASRQQDYNVSRIPPAYQGRASPARKTMPVGAGNSHKDKGTCGVSRSRPLTSTYLLSTTTSDSDGHGNSNGGSGGSGGSGGGGGGGGGSCNSCAAVGEPVARKARLCRSSVETIPTGRGPYHLRTRRPVLPQSQAKTTPLSDSSSAGGGVGSTRSQHTSISRRRSSRAHSGDGKASSKKCSALTVPLKDGSSEGPSGCPAARRKNASVMTVPSKSGSEGPSDCPLVSHNNASVVTVLLKSGSKGRSSCPAEEAVEHAGGGGGGGGGGGTRGYMASVGTDIADGLILDDAVVTTSRTTESAVPPDTSTAMNDSASSSGGSQVGDQNGVKLQPGLPSSGALADNGKGARTGLTPADHYLLFGFGSSKNTQSEDDERREERHLQKENKDEGGRAKPLCDPCGSEGVLPTTAISRNVPKAQPGACRADDRVAISGKRLQKEKLFVQGVVREPKQVASVKTELELQRQDSKESLMLPHAEALRRASESRAKAREARYTASQTEAEVRQDSTRRGSLLPRPKTLPRTSKSRAKARVARYAAAKGAAEKVLKDALEAIEIHNNASVKLARHQCAEVEAKTAENEQANALLHNSLLIANVQTQASARNHHLPATEDSRFCTGAREVDIGATSTVARERHGGFFHDNDVDSRQHVNRSGSIFHAGQSAEREPDWVQRLYEQEETVAVAPEVQHVCHSALLLASAHDGRDTIKPAAETAIADAKRAAGRMRETAEFAAAALPPHYAEENTAAVARATGRVARQESDHRTKEARAVLSGSSFLERDAKEEDAMMMVASDCRKRHLIYLKRQNKFEENAWRLADAGMKSARASIAAEFASIRLHLSQQHAAQLAVAARATVKTSDATGSLMRRVSVLEEEWKDDRRRVEDNSLPIEECHAETACRIAAMRSRNNARTAARLGALKNNSC